MNRRQAIEPIPCGATAVLLHTCCAPCSSAIVEWLMSQGVTPTLHYCNPNIYPFDEYLKRRDECARYARHWGVAMIDDAYNHSAWLQTVAGHEDAPERGSRCELCFKMRLERSARCASELGLPLLATTLASSRWKNLEQIARAGEKACSTIEGVQFWNRNWRKGGLYERRAQIIRQQQFYTQRYCGCEFSMKHLTDKQQS